MDADAILADDHAILAALRDPERGGGNKQRLADLLGVTRSRVRRAVERAERNIGVTHIPAPAADHPTTRTKNLGPPPLLPPAVETGDERVAGLWDPHGEDVDQGLLDAFLRFTGDFDPHTLILGGDVFDFHIISRWSKQQRAKLDPLTLWDRIQQEIDGGVQIIRQLREAHPDARILMVEGNHEQRLREYLTDELHKGWDEAEIRMRLPEYGVQYFTRAGFYLRPEYQIAHGTKLTQHTAKGEYDQTRCGGVTGHKHHRSYWSETFPEAGKRYERHSMPAACHLDAAYKEGNAGLMRWEQGCFAGVFDAADPYDYHTDIGLWWKGRLTIHGKRY